MPVRPLYPPPMNFVPHPLRRAAHPFVFAGAIGLGIWLWLKLGDFSLARCPPDLVWYGGASGDKKCSWPLVVYMAKDIVGAALTGALPVLLCAAVAPVVRRSGAREQGDYRTHRRHRYQRPGVAVHAGQHAQPAACGPGRRRGRDQRSVALACGLARGAGGAAIAQGAVLTLLSRSRPPAPAQSPAATSH